jgi:hypothetical protein
MTDLEVYRLLTKLADQIEAASKRAVSPRSETAMKACAVLVRKVASAIYKASM